MKIEIERSSEMDGFNVRSGDLLCPNLTWGEMIEQVTGLSHPGIKDAHRVRYRMQTDAEWEAERAERECRMAERDSPAAGPDFAEVK